MTEWLDTTFPNNGEKGKLDVHDEAKDIIPRDDQKAQRNGGDGFDENANVGYDQDNQDCG